MPWWQAEACGNVNLLKQARQENMAIEVHAAGSLKGEKNRTFVLRFCDQPGAVQTYVQPRSLNSFLGRNPHRTIYRDHEFSANAVQLLR